MVRPGLGGPGTDRQPASIGYGRYNLKSAICYALFAISFEPKTRMALQAQGNKLIYGIFVDGLIFDHFDNVGLRVHRSLA